MPGINTTGGKAWPIPLLCPLTKLTAHPKLDIVIGGDGLYSKQPYLNELKAAKMSFVLVAKSTDFSRSQTPAGNALLSRLCLDTLQREMKQELQKVSVPKRELGNQGLFIIAIYHTTFIHRCA